VHAAAPQSTAAPAPELDVVLVSKAVGDQLRAAILRVLHDDSFGVLELSTIFDMAQPAISHHLKKLSDAGLVRRRREGTSVFYQRTPALGVPLLSALFDALDNTPLQKHVCAGIARVHAQRVHQSHHFFTHNADALSQQTALVCDPSVYTACIIDTVEAHAHIGRGQVLEIGPGGGALLQALAPHFRAVTGIDSAAEMLDQTARAVAALPNVTLLEGDFTALESAQTYDLIIAAMVVHHLPSPPGFFARAARMLKPGGLLVIAELCDHDQDWVKSMCGDVWLGFHPDELKAWAQAAGLIQTQQQFLAQRNGFRVQVSAFCDAEYPVDRVPVDRVPVDFTYPTTDTHSQLKEP